MNTINALPTFLPKPVLPPPASFLGCGSGTRVGVHRHRRAGAVRAGADRQPPRAADSLFHVSNYG